MLLMLTLQDCKNLNICRALIVLLLCPDYLARNSWSYLLNPLSRLRKVSRTQGLDKV